MKFAALALISVVSATRTHSHHHPHHIMNAFAQLSREDLKAKYDGQLVFLDEDNDTEFQKYVNNGDEVKSKLPTRKFVAKTIEIVNSDIPSS